MLEVFGKKGWVEWTGPDNGIFGYADKVTGKDGSYMKYWIAEVRKFHLDDGSIKVMYVIVPSKHPFSRVGFRGEQTKAVQSILAKIVDEARKDSGDDIDELLKQVYVK